MVGLQGDAERGDREKNKGMTSNRCMTAVLRALVFSELSVAVMVSVCPGLRSYWDCREGGGGEEVTLLKARQWERRQDNRVVVVGGALSNAGGCVCLGG